MNTEANLLRLTAENLAYFEYLNEQCQKLAPFAFSVGLVAWLPYLSVDKILQPDLPEFVFLRLGYSLVSAILLLLFYLLRSSCKSLILSSIFLLYLEVATGIISGLSGGDSAYMGGYLLVLMLLPMAPLPRSILYLIFGVSLLSFVLALAGAGFPEPDARSAYSQRDWLVAVVLVAGLTHLLGSLRKLSWDRLQLARVGESDRRRMEKIGQMAAEIVHDLKNPMTVIKGYAEMSDSDIGPDRRRAYLERISQEVDRLTGMCYDILDYAGEGIALDVREADLAFIIRQILAHNHDRLAQALIETELDLPTTQPLPLDADRIHRVLLNLIANSIEAMEGTSGPRRLRIAVKSDRERCELIVADSGPGIPPEIQQRMFEPFATAGKASGTGLGLSVVKNIVEAHLGTIAFTTGPASGTEFRITFLMDLDLNTERRTKERRQESERRRLDRRQAPEAGPNEIGEPG